MENFFKIFNIDSDYKVNKKQLSQKYLMLQALYHPDKANNENEKLLYTQKSASLNDGYNILKNDLKRAIYILELNGINFSDDNPDLKADNDFLLEVFAKQEELNEIANSIEMLEIFLNQLQDEFNHIIDQLNLAFNNNEYDQALKLTIQLKYIDKLLADTKKIKNNL